MAIPFGNDDPLKHLRRLCSDRTQPVKSPTQPQLVAALRGIGHAVKYLNVRLRNLGRADKLLTGRTVAIELLLQEGVDLGCRSIRYIGQSQSRNMAELSRNQSPVVEQPSVFNEAAWHRAARQLDLEIAAQVQMK